MSSLDFVKRNSNMLAISKIKFVWTVCFILCMHFSLMLLIIKTRKLSKNIYILWELKLTIGQNVIFMIFTRIILLKLTLFIIQNNTSHWTGVAASILSYTFVYLSLAFCMNLCFCFATILTTFENGFSWRFAFTL